MLLLTASKNSSQLGQTSTDSKFIAPTLHLSDAAFDGLQFQEQGNNMVDSSKDSSSRRYFTFRNMEASSEVNYKIHVSNFANLPPLKLASKYISDLTKVDSMTPSDIYSDEHINKSGAGLDHYFFDYEKGLGELSRFEKIKQLDLPNKFFEEYNSTECITKIGMFPEISRAWIIVDNKLTLWNYKLPQSSFNESAQFFTIDQLKHSILTAKLVKPREGVFVKEVNYLLIISTVTDIHIFLIEYNESTNSLEVFNPNLSVSTQGLIVNKFAVHLKTNEIYFSGEGNGVNVWRLEYTNKSSFIKNKCDKTCLTKSGISSVLPISKISGFDFFSTDSSSNTNTNNNNTNKPENQKVQEFISQLVVDSERDVLYTLSNKSCIRAYKLSKGQEQFTQHSHISPSEIFKAIASLFVNSQNIKAFLKFRIMTITTVSAEESSNVQLVAVTNYGFRIFFKLGSSASFSSYFLKSLGTSYGLKMSVVTVKFPPSKDLPQANPELDSFTRNKQYLSQMVLNQQQSTLLQNTKLGKVISPGVFICVKRTKGSDKLYVSTTNYGILKKTNKVVEDAEFLNINDRVDENSAIFIHDIVQLTPSMNATNTPNGYANILASQYTKAPLQFAVLTNFGISIYQYRTPDRILKACNEEVLEVFIGENGFEEACSSLLYLACSYGNSTELYKQQAKFYFATLGNNARLLEYSPASAQVGEHTLPYNQMVNIAKNDSHPTVEQVVLSDRFYGTCMLISRIFRDYWNSKVFIPLPHIKIDSNGRLELSSVSDDNLLIKGLGINKKEIEFFIGSIIVLIEFFVESGSKIQGLNTPNYSSDPNKFAAEVCIRAEHIAFTSVLKSLGAIKEGLSFLMVLIEEMETNETNFSDIMKFLSLNIQVNLLQLTFKDLLLPGRDVRNLIKDLLSSIINKNILKGGSIDLIASSLKGRCGSFCSADDVYIFKAIENLNRAKNIGNRDNELKIKFLKNAVELFEKAYDSLTLENIENSINIMLDLEFYTGAVDLLLKLALKIGTLPAIVLPVNSELFNGDLQKSSNAITKANENAKKKKQLYDMVFNILVRVDVKTIQVHETHNQLRINELVEIRDTVYQICFASNDRAFQYDFYQWFMNQGANERLLDINTPFILPFLEEKAQKDLICSDLLWLYHAKRENYFAAGQILYSLAVSEFHLTLDRRVEYMSRANGFCNCTCPPNLRQKMIQLSTQLQELLDVASLQLDILTTIRNDSRISVENKKLAENALGFKVLGISELFNDYTDPLGYYALSLLVFKISDYKNSDEILKRWTLLFEKIYHKFVSMEAGSRDALYVSIEKIFHSISPKLSSSDLIFPIDELIKMIAKTIHEAEAETKDPQQKPPQGYLIELFIKSGINYDKLYHVIKSLIEQNAYEVYPKFTDYLKKEMLYLIQQWYKTDKMLRELISGDKIRGLTSYSLESDPILGLEGHNI
ncbi:uncharacterized protein KQ657_003683 [Scheffersomyces spartinae]|uniref:Nucleoporin n=1 Tax=Scheffersomyces spartinae TaxID=45513 RepID=A0A9P7VD69_9ASCO|nr:uncharacterized protein KQ657_003683 [Scheffersomyces spartinae]KAG7195159.1 hypothetical protein KQ657_003683 [Scheffersomyces spartinae]